MTCMSSLFHRYSQLIYLTLIGKRMNLPYLHRDAILVRFFHAFLSSAPHLVVHLYATIVPFFPSSSSFPSSVNPMEPAVLSALAISTASMLYTLLSFALNDRVSGKARRVILPAHLTQVLWHVCMVASRVVAFALFGYVYGYYVVAVIGGHWLLMVFVLLLERTTFCADIERQANGELKFTRRLCLEIPFDILAAAVYVFVYFNPKRGRTRVWAGIYHVVTLAENVVMGALFFVFLQNEDNSFHQPPPFYLVISGLAVVAGLYPLGIIFMVFYYLLYHPKRTGKCYWIGIPRKCLFCCSQKGESEEEVMGTKYRHRNSSIIISGPTLVSHNGFVPRNLLPVGPNATIPSELSVSQSGGSVGNGLVRSSRDRSVTEPVETEGPRIPLSGVGANVGSETTQDLGTSLTLVSPFSSRTNTARTASESNQAFSDILPSELDTDCSSNPVMDTVIDTPLFGTTPDAADVSESRQTRTRLGSQDTESQKTYTNDTGIDVDSDLQLSPGVMGCDMEDAGRGAEDVTSPHNATAQQQNEVTLPVFVDVPVKQRKSKGSLEMHYFPNAEKELNSDMPLQASATANAPSRRESVTPTLPTPTYTPSPTSTPNTTRAQWRYPSEGSEDVFQPRNTSSPRAIRRENSPPSQPSPDRTRRAPRSPIGARSFQVNNEDVDLSQNSQHSSHTPSQPRAVTPRSPKGARRLLVQQPSPVPTAQSRRQPPPPPPVPPKTTSQEVFSPPPPSSSSMAPSSSNMPPPVSSMPPPISVAAPVQNDSVASSKRAPPSPPKPITSDGITRGLSSLVPGVSNRRAHSSSPNPISRHHIAQHRSGISPGRGYHRPSSFTPAYATPERVPKGVSNYKRVSAVESQLGSGSLHNLQLHHAPQRPKSDGWRVDRSAITQPLQQQQRAPRRQSALNSHGSSPERSTFHSSTSSDQRVTSLSSANSVENYNRQQLHEASTRNVDAQMKRNSTAGAAQSGYSHRVPRSAFSRVSPERSRAHHISAPQQLLENYPVTSSGQQSGSPRHYPKYPQGAQPNAPKLIKSPPPKGVPINVPPPLPPLRRDYNSNNEPSNTTDNAQRRGSGEYDKLPAEINMGGAAEDQHTPKVGAGANRNSLMCPSSYQASTQASHLANRRSYINPTSSYQVAGTTVENTSNRTATNVNNRRSLMGPTSYLAAGLRDNAHSSQLGAGGNRRSFVSPTSFRPPQSSNHESVV